MSNDLISPWPVLFCRICFQGHKSRWAHISCCAGQRLRSRRYAEESTGELTAESLFDPEGCFWNSTSHCLICCLCGKLIFFHFIVSFFHTGQAPGRLHSDPPIQNYRQHWMCNVWHDRYVETSDTVHSLKCRLTHTCQTVMCFCFVLFCFFACGTRQIFNIEQWRCKLVTQDSSC